MSWALVQRSLKPSKVWAMSVVERSCLKLLMHIHTNSCCVNFCRNKMVTSSFSFCCPNQFWDSNPFLEVVDLFEEFMLQFRKTRVSTIWRLLARVIEWPTAIMVRLSWLGVVYYWLASRHEISNMLVRVLHPLKHLEVIYYEFWRNNINSIHIGYSFVSVKFTSSYYSY